MNQKIQRLSNGVRVISVYTPEFKSVNLNLMLRGGPAIESKEPKWLDALPGAYGTSRNKDVS